MDSSDINQRFLITGANGFVGTHLMESIQRQCPKVVACVGWSESEKLPELPGVTWQQLDIRDSGSVEQVVSDTRPTTVIHLAAISHVPTAFANPERVWQVNVMGTLYLLESLKRHASDATVLYVSSSEIYGDSFASAQPLDETAPLAPKNPYAASKAAADLMAGQYADGGMRIIRVRPFNHVGPGQSTDFVVSAFASQIARMEKGLQEPVLSVGNLDAKRDFLHVRDVVDAYLTLIDHSSSLSPGEIFNICSGIPRSIREILEGLLSLSERRIEVRQERKRLRPSEIPVAVGSAAKLKAETDWAPAMPWEEVLRQTLDYWRGKVS